MRTTGPEWSNEGTAAPPIKLVRYIMTAIANPIRMIQQTTYPPVVTVSDVKFLIVMTRMMIEMINNILI